MKKYLLIFIVPFLFFSTGCEEDTIQDTQLDSELYGNWTDYSNSYYYDMTLSSNGMFVYQVRYYSEAVQSSHSGMWWVEGNRLALSDNGGWGMTEDYVVSGNTLEYDNQTWEKN